MNIIESLYDEYIYPNLPMKHDNPYYKERWRAFGESEEIENRLE